MGHVISTGIVHPPSGGIRALNFTRNGDSATSQGILDGVVNYLNSQSGHRRRILFSFCGDLANLRSDPTSASQCYARFRTGPYSSVIVAEMIVAPASNTATSVSPKIRWEIVEDPGGAAVSYQQPYIQVNRRRTGTAQPSDFITVKQRWSGNGNTTRLSEDIEISAICVGYEYARIVGCTIYEEIWTAGTGAGTNVVSPRFFTVGAPMLASRVDQITDLMTNLWKKQASPLWSWAETSLAGATNSTTSATYVGLLNSSITDWSANAEGWWTWPRYCGTKESNNVQCTVVAEGLSSTGTGTMALRSAAGADLCTLTFTAGVPDAQRATFNLDATQDSQLIVPLFKANSGGSLVVSNVSAFIYES